MEKDVKKRQKGSEHAGGREKQGGRGMVPCLDVPALLWEGQNRSAFGVLGGRTRGQRALGVQDKASSPGERGSISGSPPGVSPRCAEEDTTYWRNTSFLLRNLKKVGSQTSPRRRHVSVQACCVSDTHTCSESTGGQARGSRRALGDHTRWVALGDRASTLGGLCIAGLLVLGGGGGDVVVQKS